jgi:hypothetical protein
MEKINNTNKDNTNYLYQRYINANKYNTKTNTKKSINQNRVDYYNQFKNI